MNRPLCRGLTANAAGSASTDCSLVGASCGSVDSGKWLPPRGARSTTQTDRQTEEQIGGRRQQRQQVQPPFSSSTHRDSRCCRRLDSGTTSTATSGVRRPPACLPGTYSTFDPCLLHPLLVDTTHRFRLGQRSFHSSKEEPVPCFALWLLLLLLLDFVVSPRLRAAISSFLQQQDC